MSSETDKMWETTQEYIRNGQKYRVQKSKHHKAEGGGAVGIIFLIWFYLFTGYTNEDFQKPEYLLKAEAGAQQLVIAWQKQNWRPRGFTDDVQIISNEPVFDVKISKSLEPIENRVNYLGDGVFYVVVATDTTLTSKAGHSATIHEVVNVKIQTPMDHGWAYRKILGDDWQIIEAEEGYKEPSLEDLNLLIQQWRQNNGP